MTYCDECKKEFEDIIQHYSDEHNKWPELVLKKKVVNVRGAWWINE